MQTNKPRAPAQKRRCKENQPERWNQKDASSPTPDGSPSVMPRAAHLVALAVTPSSVCTSFGVVPMTSSSLYTSLGVRWGGVGFCGAGTEHTIGLSLGATKYGIQKESMMRSRYVCSFALQPFRLLSLQLVAGYNSCAEEQIPECMRRWARYTL